MKGHSDLSQSEKILIDLARDEEKIAEISEWVERLNSGRARISECTREFASQKIAFLLSYIGRQRGSPRSLQILADENARLREECKRLWKMESRYNLMRRRPEPELPARLNQPA